MALPKSSAPKCIDPESFSLTACLSCAGCLEKGEESSFAADVSFATEQTDALCFVISPYVKRSLYGAYRHASFAAFEKSLILYLKEKFGAWKVVDTSFFKKNETGTISSECPAVVLYVERLYPSLVPKLSSHKTYQQIAVEYLRADEGLPAKARIVSVMQCYDKKDEDGRDGTDIDYFIGTKDLYNLIEKDFNVDPDLDYELLPWEKSKTSYGHEEISGKTACLNLLKQAKKDDTSWLELRMCEGGCSYGLAQLPGNVPEVETDVSREVSDFIPSSRRTFRPRPKRTFAVEW